MKRIIIPFIICVSIWTGITGCSAIKQGKTAHPVAQTNIQATESAYYYFLESEIHRYKGNISKSIDFIQKAIEIDSDSVYLKQELAALYLLDRKTEKSIELIENIIEEDPDNIDALIMLARIKQLLNNTDKDLAGIYDRILSIEPTQYPSIYLSLGKIYMENEEYDKAMHIYSKLIHHFPDSYAGYFFIGKLLRLQSKTDEAEKAFQKSIDIEPDLIESKFELIDIYKEKKQTSVITELYKEILERDPENVRARAELGLIYSKKYPEKADQFFRSLSEDVKSDNIVLYKIGKYFVEQDRNQDSSVILKGILKYIPENSEILYLMGIINDQMKNYNKAIEYLSKVDPESQFYIKSILHIAYLYRELKKIDLSILHLEKALLIDKKNIDLILYASSFYEEINDFKKAENTLLNGLETNKNNPKIHFYLGVLYDKIGNKESSVSQLKRVIDLDPENANALNYLGYTYAESGIKLDEAEQLIIKALKFKPNDGYITDSLGWVYYKKGFFEKAVTYLEKAVSLLPDDPLILEHLGDAYIKINDFEKALELYNRSLSNDHKDKDQIRQKISELKQMNNSAE